MSRYMTPRKLIAFYLEIELKSIKIKKKFKSKGKLIKKL